MDPPTLINWHHDRNGGVEKLLRGVGTIREVRFTTSLGVWLKLGRGRNGEEKERAI